MHVIQHFPALDAAGQCSSDHLQAACTVPPPPEAALQCDPEDAAALSAVLTPRDESEAFRSTAQRRQELERRAAEKAEAEAERLKEQERAARQQERHTQVCQLLDIEMQVRGTPRAAHHFVDSKLLVNLHVYKKQQWCLVDRPMLQLAGVTLSLLTPCPVRSATNMWSPLVGACCSLKGHTWTAGTAVSGSASELLADAVSSSVCRPRRRS